MALSSNTVLVADGGSGTPSPVASDPTAGMNDFEKWWYDLTHSFSSLYESRNPYSFEGMQAAYDEANGNDSALETAYNRSIGASTFSDLVDKLETGEATGSDILKEVAESGIRLTPSQQDWLTNVLSGEATQEQYDRSIQSIKDSYEATYNAALEAGVNPSAYMLSQGSQSVSPTKRDVTMAASNKEAQMRFERSTQMAKTMLGLIGGMASAGVYGGSVAAAKTAVAKLTSEAAKASKMTGRIHISPDGTMSKDIYDYGY